MFYGQEQKSLKEQEDNGEFVVMSKLSGLVARKSSTLQEVLDKRRTSITDSVIASVEANGCGSQESRALPALLTEETTMQLTDSDAVKPMDSSDARYSQAVSRKSTRRSARLSQRVDRQSTRNSMRVELNSNRSQ